jgi:GH25 family lysozyme M1 (1,4-beta-N-acetylmuramidase)
MYFNNYKYVTGQKKIDNNWYYFDTNGIKKTGKVSIPASANSGTSKNVLTDKDGAYITHNTKQGLVYYSISSATDSVNVGKINYEKKIVKEGIDVSQWNGNFDFTSYKNQFVIIRASWGQTHKDTKVEQFVSECERLGIPYGFYTYSYAENNTEAKKEATFVLSIIDDLKKKHGGSLKHFCMGVWFDMEDADHWKARQGFAFTNANISGLCYTFCNEISKRGYYTGTYMSASWLKYLKGSKADNFDKWVAHWGTRNSYGDMSSDTSASGTMQQYTSTGGKLDKDVIFVDPSTYKNK